VRVVFLDKKLEALYTQEKGAQRLDPAVFDAFLEVVAAVQAAKDPQDLRALKSLHYEKLERDDQGLYIEIVKIDDYHRRER
jgi:plasmid maintenance system killer protein